MRRILHTCFRGVALELLEEILSGGESRCWVQAKGIASCCYMQSGDYDRAEAYSGSSRPGDRPDSLLPRSVSTAGTGNSRGRQPQGDQTLRQYGAARDGSRFCGLPGSWRIGTR